MVRRSCISHPRRYSRIARQALRNEESDMPQEQFQICIDACNACAAACDFCATSCLKEEGVQSMTRCIELDIDCAQICRLAAAFMARDSDYAAEICDLCARICEDC